MRRINIRLPDELLERIDRARGLVPRNAYLVDILNECHRALDYTTAAGQPLSQASPPGNERSGFDARANTTAKQTG